MITCKIKSLIETFLEIMNIYAPQDNISYCSYSKPMMKFISNMNINKNLGKIDHFYEDHTKLTYVFIKDTQKRFITSARKIFNEGSLTPTDFLCLNFRYLSCSGAVLRLRKSAKWRSIARVWLKNSRNIWLKFFFDSWTKYRSTQNNDFLITKFLSFHTKSVHLLDGIHRINTSQN